MPILHASHSYSPPEYSVIKDIQSEIPLVLVTRMSDFKFNEDLKRLDKYVLVNMSELGWDYDFSRGTPIFGKNFYYFRDLYPGDEWAKFNDWISGNPPILTLQRELLNKDVWYDIAPIEYPFYGEIPPIQSFDEYIARPLNVFHYWGRSHEDRVSTHASFWMRSRHNGASICDNLSEVMPFIQRESNPNKWVTLHIPHYMRTDIGVLLQLNGMSKMGLSLPGAGKKCFRSAEVPTNSLMIMEENEMAWQFPWVDQKNCFTYKDGYFDNHPIDERNNPVDVIERVIKLHPQVIYEAYRACVENARNYQINSYSRHLEKIIQKVL